MISANFVRATSAALVVPVALALTPRPATATPAVAAPAAIACLSNPVCVLAVVVIGGVVYFEMSNAGSVSRTVAMIDDPEAITEQWTQTINASSLSRAIAKCEALAAAYTRSGGTLVRAGRTRDLGNTVYECTFVGET